MNRRTSLLLLVVLPLIGGAVGYLAGPTFARTNRTVQLAARIWLEQSTGADERTDASEAFWVAEKPDPEDLYARARTVVHRFRVGGLILGVWVGLV